jgi:serine protease Do
VLIAKVEPGSAAERAGLAVGDVLVRVGRQPVASGNDVVQALAARSSERVPLSVIRAAQLIRLAATIPGAQPSRPDRPIHHL